MRSLKYYLIEFKQKQTHCSSCQTRLQRVSLCLNGEAIGKRQINAMRQLIDEATWIELRDCRLQGLCRFCCALSTSPHPVYFDLIGFYRSLLLHSSMKLSAVHEYVARLRRLETLLVSSHLAISEYHRGMVSKIVVNHLSGAILKNTISALNKYDAYLAWCVEPDDILL
ncbi:putative flagellar regulatory protein FliZ [Providencia rettgeri DSM 1131]|uniref:hypothetical protein n=1 Tax=Providencia rettgeri TaxID=587 RepID=UPI0001C34656|nr:hypothetical protein [Providencia rettgeri]EFE51257.1 putative flagellar regulatory protein FliZ [Providencia rettgeri DSM 1131]